MDGAAIGSLAYRRSTGTKPLLQSSDKARSAMWQ